MYYFPNYTDEKITSQGEEGIFPGRKQLENHVTGLQVLSSHSESHALAINVMLVCDHVCLCVCLCVLRLDDNKGLHLWLNYIHKGSQAVSQMTNHYA